MVARQIWPQTHHPGPQCRRQTPQTERLKKRERRESVSCGNTLPGDVLGVREPDDLDPLVRSKLQPLLYVLIHRNELRAIPVCLCMLCRRDLSVGIRRALICRDPLHLVLGGGITGGGAVRVALERRELRFDRFLVAPNLQSGAWFIALIWLTAWSNDFCSTRPAVGRVVYRSNTG